MYFTDISDPYYWEILSIEGKGRKGSSLECVEPETFRCLENLKSTEKLGMCFFLPPLIGIFFFACFRFCIKNRW